MKLPQGARRMLEIRLTKAIYWHEPDSRRSPSAVPDGGLDLACYAFHSGHSYSERSLFIVYDQMCSLNANASTVVHTVSFFLLIWQKDSRHLPWILDRNSYKLSPLFERLYATNKMLRDRIARCRLLLSLRLALECV